jgi:hypothetical protein
MAVALHSNRFFRTFGADQAALEASQGSTRAFRSSKPARPYICRLIAFSRLMCPSMGPLLHGVVIDSFTASKSRCSVVANWAVNRNPEVAADTIQAFSFLALRQRSIARNWRTNRRSLCASGQKRINSSKCLFCATDRVRGGMLRSADTRPAE